jgi:hypothetical protein
MELVSVKSRTRVFGALVARLAMWWGPLVRLWIVDISCFTEFGHRWRGSVCVLAGVEVFWGNMNFAMSKASPKIPWRSAASVSIEARDPNSSWETGRGLVSV